MKRDPLHPFVEDRPKFSTRLLQALAREIEIIVGRPRWKTRLTLALIPPRAPRAHPRALRRT